MARPKTISDDGILAAAREVFRRSGHAASTREIAQKLGTSEGIIYQRFESKDALFFAAMVPREPDVQALLGPEEPPEDARAYVKEVAHRLANHFAEIMPLAMHTMTHPPFVPGVFGRHGILAAIEAGLTKRLASLTRRKRIGVSPEVAASLVVRLSHDFALTSLHAGRSAAKKHELEACIDALWSGISPPNRKPPRRRRRRSRGDPRIARVSSAPPP
jgi:AcrR family transcriptional regulator